ncbi:MAG: methyl-accepting chemotaxis protein, partial [Lachnospiraceae bacterium]|nr:methyl-accepting chemotaxis protein [Lachnospiraceae bacterium]
MKEQKNKVLFLHSIKLKILLLVIGAVFISVSFCMWASIPSAKDSITTLTEHYMEDIAEVAGENLEWEIDSLGYDKIMKVEELEKHLGDVNIQEMESSYAYLVAKDSTMLYHPTASKIGQPVENEVVKQLLAELNQGNRKETTVIKYEFKGVMKYASFYIDQQMRFILVVTADEDEILSSVSVLTRKSVIGGIIILIICGVIGLVVALRITKPIESTTRKVVRLADLDFVTVEGEEKNMKSRKDEAGVMNQAILV